MVTDPGRFDVIVTDNLFGDIITDLAAAVCGGIGLAASGNIDATRTNPSMFEPVHGSAPDIAGQGIADPTAAIMSVALLLSHVGEDDAAARVDKAVEQHLATRGDEKLSTTEVGDRILPACRRSVALVHRFDGVQVRVETGRQGGCLAHVLAASSGSASIAAICLGTVPLRVVDDAGAVGAQVDVGRPEPGQMPHHFLGARASTARPVLSARSGSTVKTLIRVAYLLFCSMVVISPPLSGSLHLDHSTDVRFLSWVESETERAVGYLVKRVQQSLRRRMRRRVAVDGSVDGAVRRAARARRSSRGVGIGIVEAVLRDQAVASGCAVRPAILRLRRGIRSTSAGARPFPGVDVRWREAAGRSPCRGDGGGL